MKILVAGCSISSGWGFKDQKLSPYIWPNIVAQTLSVDVTNIAVTASSNYDIFLSVLHEQTVNHYDLVLTQWTGLDRITVSSGLESYLILNKINPQISDSPLLKNFSTKELKTFSKIITTVHNNWKSFTDLAKMTQLLSQMSTPNFFINGMSPWTSDFFNNHSRYEAFTKSLLCIDTDASKVLQCIQQAKHQLVTDRWINLVQGWQMAQIDTVSITDNHAGPESHKFYANQVLNFLKEKQCQI
jgi:hypothetical protein